MVNSNGGDHGITGDATSIKSKCLDAGDTINLMMHNDMGRETRPITHTQGRPAGLRAGHHQGPV